MCALVTCSSVQWIVLFLLIFVSLLWSIIKNSWIFIYSVCFKQLYLLLFFDCPIFDQRDPSILVSVTFWHTYLLWMDSLFCITRYPTLVLYISCPRPEMRHSSEWSWFLLVGNCIKKSKMHDLNYFICSKKESLYMWSFIPRQ